MVTQLQDSVDRNLSWSEGNITVNLTDQRQIELKKMNDTYQPIFQHQEDMLDQVQQIHIHMYWLCTVAKKEIYVNVIVLTYSYFSVLYHIMQIVRGGKVLQMDKAFLIHWKTFMVHLHF